MATTRTIHDDPERLRLIAEALGVPVEAIVDWRMESTGTSGALLTATVAAPVDQEAVQRIINA